MFLAFHTNVSGKQDSLSTPLAFIVITYPEKQVFCPSYPCESKTLLSRLGRYSPNILVLMVLCFFQNINRFLCKVAFLNAEESYLCCDYTQNNIQGESRTIIIW